MSIKTRVCAALLVVAATHVACGGGATAPEGRYQLDKDAFIEMAVKTMREHERIPEGAEDIARGMLRQIEMEFDLRDGGEFHCTQKAPGENHVYTGRWYLNGRQIRIVQTHEDGKEVPDSMSGTYENGVLNLQHEEEGMQMTYVLHKAEATPAAPR